MLFKGILRGTDESGVSCDPRYRNMIKIKSVVFGFIVALGIFGYTKLYGVDWKFLQTDFQGEFFYDSENVTRTSEHLIGVWLKIVYSEKFKKQEDLKNLSQTAGLWEIDCRDRKVCLLSTTHYSQESEISGPQVWFPPEWKSVRPGTMMETLYKELCK
jgi:hypothetical protein